jgi:hypothetical protein
MALKLEGVVHGGVHAQEALRGSTRTEALHLALSSCAARIFLSWVVHGVDPKFL